MRRTRTIFCENFASLRPLWDFCVRICPSTVEEIKLALHQRLSNKRVASAVEIALKAQELLCGRANMLRTKLVAHPDMVRRILENGSWTVDDWIRQ